MEFNQVQFNMDSVDSLTSADRGSSGGESSGGDLAVGGKSSRNREPLEPLIVAALRSAPDKRLLLSDIYRYIETHSADYRRVDDSTAAVAAPPSSSTSTGQDDQRKKSKEPAWKINVRHILSVKRDVFPLLTEKDSKRRGRYHALDELAYASRLAAKALRGDHVDVVGAAAESSSHVPTSCEPVKRHLKRRIRSQVYTTDRRRIQVGLNWVTFL